MKHKYRLLTGVCILLLMLLSGCQKTKTSSAASIIVATDLHYLAEELTDHGEFYHMFVDNADGKVMHYSEGLMDALVENVIAKHPQALVLSGDLTFNGEKISHMRLAEKLKKITEEGIPVYVIPGNHDLDNANAASFEGEGYTLIDSVMEDEFAEIYKDLGFSQAIDRDPTSLSYIVEPAEGVRILMVDANTLAKPCMFTEDTLKWVEEQLKQAEDDGAKVLSVTHQNLMAHNKRMMVGYIAGNSNRLRELYAQYHVVANLSGHIHMQHIMEDENGVVDIATASLAVSPNQYGVISINDQSFEYQTEAMDTTSIALRDEDQTEEIQDFASYCKDFFWRNRYNQALATVANEDEREEMAVFFADANLAYFGGRPDELDWSEDMIDKWQSDQSRFTSYINTIMEEKDSNWNTYSRPLSLENK